MDSSTSATSVAGADRRRAHRRVGAGATASFLVLLLLGAVHGPAEADPAAPTTVRPGPSTAEPAQPAPTRRWARRRSAPATDVADVLLSMGASLRGRPESSARIG